MEHYVISYVTNKNKGLYLKDPMSSELGKSILANSVEMISSFGLDEFTFKKLSVQLNSSEASIYRYFENKYCLCMYVCDLYWAWLDYEIMFKTINMENSKLKVEILINTICLKPSDNIVELSGIKIHNIVIKEWNKLLQHNWIGLQPTPSFGIYLSLIERISSVLSVCNQMYSFPTMLSNTIIETSLMQKFNTQFQQTDSLHPFLTQLTLATLYN